jgi:hypothetical protein
MSYKIKVRFQRNEGNGEIYTVSGLEPTVTVGELKDRIGAVVSPRPSRLYEFGEELANDTKTLADYGLRLGGEHYLSENPISRPNRTAGRRKTFKMPRKMTRKYCKKTPCKKMGFTQRSSCRPWKNCFHKK